LKPNIYSLLNRRQHHRRATDQCLPRSTFDPSQLSRREGMSKIDFSQLSISRFSEPDPQRRRRLRPGSTALMLRVSHHATTEEFLKFLSGSRGGEEPGYD